MIISMNDWVLEKTCCDSHGSVLGLRLRGRCDLQPKTIHLSEIDGSGIRAGENAGQHLCPGFQQFFSQCVSIERRD
jgi:hypothetical protein